MAEKVDQISKDKVIGKKVTEVFPRVVEFGLFSIFQNVYRSGKPEHFPVSIYKDDRIKGYRENYVYKLPSGEIVAVYQDHTKRKQTEEDLEKHREHLEELVKERTKELDNTLKVFVGRELIIRDLQNQIKELGGK